MAVNGNWKAMTPEDLIVAMQLPGNCITPIKGTPDCMSLLNALSEIHEGCKQIRCPYSLHGYAYKTLPDNLYALLTGEQVIPPADPGEIPHFDDNISNAANSNRSTNFARAKQLFDQDQNIDTACIKLLKDAFTTDTRMALSTMFSSAVEHVFIRFFDSCW